MNRSRMVKVRVTEAEYADWSRKAVGASVSLSEAIRRAMGGNPFLESGGVFRCPHDRPHYIYCSKCAK